MLHIQPVYERNVVDDVGRDNEIESFHISRTVRTPLLHQFKVGDQVFSFLNHPNSTKESWEPSGQKGRIPFVTTLDMLLGDAAASSTTRNLNLFHRRD